jgi:hypothetical protein
VYVGDMRHWLSKQTDDPAQLADVKKMCDHAALMQDHERAAAKSNSLTGAAGAAVGCCRSSRRPTTNDHSVKLRDATVVFCFCNTSGINLI